jgi:hypothetical protein
MTRDEATRKIKKLLGPKALLEARGEISAPDKRERAREAARFLKARTVELDAKIAARQKELLDVPDYQAMLAERKTLRKDANDLLGDQLHYKFQAGTLGGFTGFPIFHVEAQGDTWEEVIAKLEEKKKKP